MFKGLANTAVGLAVLVALALVVEHFSHDAQPQSRGNSIPGYDYIQGRTLAEIPLVEMARRENEPVLAYVTRVTQMVHKATYHCLPDQNSVSWIETAVNYAAYKAGHDANYDLGLYNFRTLRCGYCSERAAAVTRILRRSDLDAITYGLGGHVVSKVMIDGTAYFTDPDYGVGPYPANLDFAGIEELYTHSVIPQNANMIAAIVTDPTGSGPYLSEEYLTSLRDLRRKLHFVANAAASGLLVFSLVAACFFRPRWSMLAGKPLAAE
ncbi:hypothetical protein ACIPO9_01260 [Pseudomonas sp. NPDC090203]|jgi:hypothetical protein|uniref:hypothetical protein n=1 Tax=Pseudomonas TaxID=286 RepID=UPI0023644873|nr:hypothetical protein [Pseudomonas putida]MDD1968899.1 hypothetical protein [Pseudomonas putida]